MDLSAHSSVTVVVYRSSRRALRGDHLGEVRRRRRGFMEDRERGTETEKRGGRREEGTWS